MLQQKVQAPQVGQRVVESESVDRLGDYAPFFVNGQDSLIMAYGAYGAYFDESERLEDGDPLCVAGFVFKVTAYKQFCRAWRPFLRSALNGKSIKAMHMTDLVQGKKEFKGIDIPTRVKCLERAVGIVCKHALLVTGAIVDQKEFEETAGPDWPQRFGSSYTALCGRAAQTTAEWMQEKRRFEPIVYTFESGHKWENETNRIFKNIGRTQFLRDLYQYGHHTFAEKCDCYGAQAADIAAWTSVRVRMKDFDKPSSAAFVPAVGQMVSHFKVNNDSMIRVLTGDVLKDFVNQQLERPLDQDVPIDAGPAKRTFR
jgi:hypothetical protein